MEKYFISRQKTGNRGFWTLIFGLFGILHLILVLIYPNKVPTISKNSLT